MSTYVMALCWGLKRPPAEKAVLISLADQANDHGYCWPSIATICTRTGYTERTVQGAIQSLVSDGLVEVELRPGRSTNYRITVDVPDLTPRKICGGQQMHQTPAATAPTPAADAPNPRSSCTQNRKEPSKNRKEPSNKKMAVVEIELPSWLPAEAWSNWDTQRKAMNAKGWTPLAQKKSIDTLTRLHDAGHDVVAVISNAIEKGWAGLYAPRQDAAKQPAASRHGGFDQRSYGEGGAL